MVAEVCEKDAPTTMEGRLVGVVSFLKEQLARRGLLICVHAEKLLQCFFSACLRAELVLGRLLTNQKSPLPAHNVLI